MSDAQRPLNPWHRNKERGEDLEGYSHYTIRIERSHHRSAEIYVYSGDEIDGLVVEDFRNYAMINPSDTSDDAPPSDPLTMTEWRQLAKKLLTLMKQTNKACVYSDVMNKKLESSLVNVFGAEIIFFPKGSKLVEHFGVEKFTKISRDALEKIASAT